MRAPAGIELLSECTWDCGSTGGSWSPGECGCGSNGNTRSPRECSCGASVVRQSDSQGESIVAAGWTSVSAALDGVTHVGSTIASQVNTEIEGVPQVVTGIEAEEETGGTEEEAVFYCCCVKKMTVKAEGSKREPVTITGTKQRELRTTNRVSVDLELEMQEDKKAEKDSQCTVEWYESGIQQSGDYDASKDPKKPSFKPDAWNAAHARTTDGRKDADSLKNKQQSKLVDYQLGEGSLTPTITNAADDEPWGGGSYSLDVLIVAKSTCPGCKNCCVWLKYEYGANSGEAIDIETLGAECGEKCDAAIPADYSPFVPFKDQLKKPDKPALSRGQQGGFVSVNLE